MYGDQVADAFALRVETRFPAVRTSIIEAELRTVEKRKKLMDDLLVIHEQKRLKNERHVAHNMENGQCIWVSKDGELVCDEFVKHEGTALCNYHYIYEKKQRKTRYQMEIDIMRIVKAGMNPMTLFALQLAEDAPPGSAAPPPSDAAPPTFTASVLPPPPRRRLVKKPKETVEEPDPASESDDDIALPN